MKIIYEIYKYLDIQSLINIYDVDYKRRTI